MSGRRYNQTLISIAERLGIADKNDLFTKAEEFNRLADVKHSCGSLNLNETNKWLIFLELAANFYSYTFNLEAAYKLFNIKRSQYVQLRNTVKRIIGIADSQISVSSGCAQLSITNSNVQVLADKLLKQYQNSNCIDTDSNQNAYVMAAICAACKQTNVKIPDSKLYQLSALSKRDQWKALVDQFSQLQIDQTEHKQDNRHFGVDNSMTNTDIDLDIDHKKVELEPYDSWKERILTQAFTNLENERNNKLKNH